MMIHKRLAAASVLAVFVASPGCITLKAEHNDLAAKVTALEQQTVDRSASLDQEIELAEARLAELQVKLAEAERLLRGSQAGLGARMDDVEQQLAELRGAAENAEFVSSAAGQSLQELRTDVDQRLGKLEEKLNEATSIPEDKNELWSEADRQLTKAKNYKQSRRLYRTYVSRYPGDARQAEAKFKVGQTFYNERDYKSALGEFYRLIQEEPESAILPDALYYSGLGFAKLGQCQNAIQYFNAVTRLKDKASEQHLKAAKGQIELLQRDKGEICLDTQDSSAGAAGKQAVDKAATTAPAPADKPAEAKPAAKPAAKKK